MDLLALQGSSDTTSTSEDTHSCFVCTNTSATYWFSCSNAECGGPNGDARPAVASRRCALCVRCAQEACHSCMFCQCTTEPHTLSLISGVPSERSSEMGETNDTISVCSDAVSRLETLLDLPSSSVDADVFDIADLVCVGGRVAIVMSLLGEGKLHCSFLRQSGDFTKRNIWAHRAKVISKCRDEHERARRLQLVGYACFTCETAGCTGKLMTCAACRKAKYCSKGCQKKDWPRHRHECEKHRETFNLIFEVQRCLELGTISSRYLEDVDRGT